MRAAVSGRVGADRERSFVDSAFRRFFIPSFLSSLGLALGGMVDCLVVGTKLGPEGLSAISLGIPVYMFYNLLSYGFSIGGSIHYASALGDGRPEEGVRLFNNVLRALLGVYLVTAALGILFLPQLLRLLGADPAYPEVYAIAERYVRVQLICVPVMFCQGPFYYFVHCDDAPKRAAAALVTSNIVDIVLNYVFVIRMDMGAEGSVWSTAVGAVFCLVICMSHIVRREGALRLRWVPFRLDDLIRSIRTGFASAVQYVYQFATVLAANQLLMSSGGTVGVAVFDVIYNLSQLTVAVSDGVGMTLQPMVSTYRAERNRLAVRRTMNLSIRYGTVLSLLVAAALAAGAEPLCAFFGLLGADNALGALALRIYSLGILFTIFNQCAVYYDQAVGRERRAFLIQTLRLFLCFLPLCMLLSRMGQGAFWWVFPLSETGALVYVLAGLRRTRRTEGAAEDKPVYSAYIQEPSALGPEVESLQHTCEDWGCSAQQSYYATLVVEELCAAILEDAGRNRRPDVLIKLTVVPVDGGMALYLRDNSYQFNPFEMEAEPDGEVNTLGMSIVKKKAKAFFYRRYLGFNTLVVKL